MKELRHSSGPYEKKKRAVSSVGNLPMVYLETQSMDLTTDPYMAIIIRDVPNLIYRNMNWSIKIVMAFCKCKNWTNSGKWEPLKKAATLEEVCVYILKYRLQIRSLAFPESKCGPVDIFSQGTARYIKCQDPYISVKFLAQWAQCLLYFKICINKACIVFPYHLEKKP